MSECIVSRRGRLRALAETLAAIPSVVATDLVDDADGDDVLVLEVVARGGVLPARAVERIGNARCGVSDVSPQGDCVVGVVR